MAKRKRRRSSNNFKPNKAATGVWYVLTTMSTALLTALLLGIVLSNETTTPSWMLVAIGIDVAFIIWLIYSRNFTTSETIAWRTKR